MVGVEGCVAGGGREGRREGWKEWGKDIKVGYEMSVED